MADPSESTTHGLYLTGNFEIEKKTSPENGWRSEYRTYTTCISAGGAHRKNPASKVSPTTGSKEYDVGATSNEAKGGDVKPNVTSKKPAKFIPRSLHTAFKSPVLSTDSESPTSLQFGPSDFTPSSFSPASSRPTAGPSNSSSDSATTPGIPTLPSKRKGRAQPKRNPKKRICFKTKSEENSQSRFDLHIYPNLIDPAL
ncbi:uncharacterized protein MELLADRAFT_64732 [Melampsora larici-populina 98AG31]|uniref:Uncharacterized protein n=1 Tax=Melampsora larici-populina (strain 98AG31 / pathotype 3-4-7) TaxID=747676 RepID=F4RSK1_MELLP|nr:uncharacterized protein MELLADRAFT_64732 [Melampsora larici-populina 98AG31]EGG04681.1 hypothetical protein MELLADRAFT_64732 [Melampsora larici-populina 98AG31]